MNLKKTSSIPVSIALFLIPAAVLGQVRLPKLIGDGMVLQRNTEVRLWAARNEEVAVNFNKWEYQTVANESGEWDILLNDLQAGGQ